MNEILKEEAIQLSRNSKSRLTVCIPVYNGAKFLQDSLDSLASQSGVDMDVFVVDNCSTDGTVEICRSYNDPRFRLVRNPENVGSIRNHNICLDIVGTEYAKLLSADDVLTPFMLSRQMQEMDRQTDVGVVSCNLIETRSDLTPMKEVPFLPGWQSGITAIRACTRKMQNVIGGPSATLLRMSAVGTLRFRTDLHWLSDLAFHCMILRNSNFQNIDVPGFLYRRHFESDSVVGCKPEIRFRDERKFLSEFGGSTLTYARIYFRAFRGRIKTMTSFNNR